MGTRKKRLPSSREKVPYKKQRRVTKEMIAFRRINTIKKKLALMRHIERAHLKPGTPMGRLTPIEKQFIINLLIHGMNPKDAKSQADGTAGVTAAKLLEKPRVAMALEEALIFQGLDRESLLSKLKEGLEATVVSKGREGDVIESDVPDLNIRLSYLKTALDLHEKAEKIRSDKGSAHDSGSMAGPVTKEGVVKEVEEDMLEYLQNKHRAKDSPIVVEIVDKEKQGETEEEEDKPE